MKPKRGRPRSYDPERAMDAALAVFWSRGYAATTLDALSEATCMQRPSLYAAFGDKDAIFQRSLKRFQARMSAQSAEALAAPELNEALLGVLLRIIDVYAPVGELQKGCLVFGVASVDAGEDPRIRAVVAKSVQRLDAAFSARIQRAIEEGALSPQADVQTLARLMSSMVHSISVRARSGEGRRALRQFARKGVQLLLQGVH